MTRAPARVVDAHVHLWDPARTDWYPYLSGGRELNMGDVTGMARVTLTGFAKLSKVKRAARVGRNPQTGEPVKIKAKTVAKITPLKGFKDVVLGVSPAPKIVAAKKVASPAKKVVPAATKASAPTDAPGWMSAPCSTTALGCTPSVTMSPAVARWA